MGKRRKNRRKQADQPVGQCKDCTVTYCPTSKQEACAKADFMAIVAGTAYECPDREAPYWEKMCA